MNGKKAKSIRALARAKTIGLPNVVHIKTNLHDKFVGFAKGIGGVQKPVFAKCNTTVLGNCTKQASKKIKKMFPKGKSFSCLDDRILDI